METKLTEDELRASRAAVEKCGSGPAAARVENARRTRKKRIMMFDEGLGM